MAAYQKFQPFVANRNRGKHNFTTAVLQVALCNAANPPLVGEQALTDLVQIAYTNLSSRVLTTSSEGQVAGVYKITIADLILSAAGGPVAAFQYVVVYNPTPVGFELISFFDRGSELTLADGEQVTLDFDDANGLFQDS